MDSLKNLVEKVKGKIYLSLLPFVGVVAMDGLAVVEGNLTTDEAAQRAHDALPAWFKPRATVADIKDWAVSGFDFLEKTINLFTIGKIALAEAKQDNVSVA